MTYDFDVVYKMGTDNKAADALFKVPSQELSCMALSSISPTLYQKILESYEKDEGIQKLLQELE